MGRPDKPGTPADYVDTVADLPQGAVESVEGVNEWDLFGATRPGWATEAATWQQELYEETKANPATSHLPVLSPSMAFKWNYAALPDLSAWSDKANAHMYPGGWKPSNEISQITGALRTVVPVQAAGRDRGRLPQRGATRPTATCRSTRRPPVATCRGCCSSTWRGATSGSTAMS